MLPKKIWVKSFHFQQFFSTAGGRESPFPAPRFEMTISLNNVLSVCFQRVVMIILMNLIILWKPHPVSCYYEENPPSYKKTTLFPRIVFRGAIISISCVFKSPSLLKIRFPRFSPIKSIQWIYLVFEEMFWNDILRRIVFHFSHRPKHLS